MFWAPCDGSIAASQWRQQQQHLTRAFTLCHALGYVTYVNLLNPLLHCFQEFLGLQNSSQLPCLQHPSCCTQATVHGSCLPFLPTRSHEHGASQMCPARPSLASSYGPIHEGCWLQGDPGLLLGCRCSILVHLGCYINSEVSASQDRGEAWFGSGEGLSYGLIWPLLG